MAKGMRITPNLKVEKVDLKIIEDYQRAVDGYIEAVTLELPEAFGEHAGIRATMYVNEEYLLGQFGPKDYNIIATTVAMHTGRPDLHYGILGPVVMVGDVNRQGEDTDLHEAWISTIKAIASMYRNEFMEVNRPKDNEGNEGNDGNTDDGSNSEEE